VDESTSDDAAVLRIDGERVLVQTVDFFTPIVDDPYLFGAIAAANSVSDIYAMGAEPILGLAIAGFPSKKLPLQMLESIFRGGVDKAAEAGFPIAGGHTIIDDVPKYGVAVTGIAPIGQIVRNSTGKAGDRLYLTKPIGNGILVAAWRARGSRLARMLRRDRPSLDEAIQWMTTLNRDASRAMVEAGASAATDITGYGMIGHLREMCRNGELGASIRRGAVPVLAGAREWLAQGLIPEGSRRNLVAYRSAIAGGASEEELLLLCDAQTSGGLLIAIPPDRAEALEAGFTSRGVAFWEVGELTERGGIIDLNG
jgi:selenide, water dikinase